MKEKKLKQKAESRKQKSYKNTGLKSNKSTRFLLILAFCIFIAFIVSVYYKPVISSHKSSKELSLREEQYIDEQYKAMEIKAKLAYLNTEDGIKHIAKLNGFVEPGEVVLQLSEKINTSGTIKPKKNIFGKYVKIACNEHTIKDKPHYNPDCVVCQKLNDIYYKQMILQEQEEAQKKAEEKKNKKETKKAKSKTIHHVKPVDGTNKPETRNQKQKKSITPKENLQDKSGDGTKI